MGIIFLLFNSLIPWKNGAGNSPEKGRLSYLSETYQKVNPNFVTLCLDPFIKLC